VRHAAPEISLISFELSMLPQLVRVIVQPETLLRLPHLSTRKKAQDGPAKCGDPTLIEEITMASHSS
jgi:hypothetical protein